MSDADDAPPGKAIVFELFDEEAMRSVVRARAEARRMGHVHIGTEHLLLSLAVGAETGTLEAAVPNGYGPEAIRAAVTDLFRRGHEAAMSDIPFSARAIGAVRCAHLEAMRHGEIPVRPSDLMRALLADPGSSACAVLRLLEEEDVRSRVTTVALPERISA